MVARCALVAVGVGGEGHLGDFPRDAAGADRKRSCRASSYSNGSGLEDLGRRWGQGQHCGLGLGPTGATRERSFVGLEALYRNLEHTASDGFRC